MKKWWYAAGTILSALTISTSIAVPVLLMPKEENNYSSSGWWKLGDNNVLFIDNPKLISHLDQVILKDNNNNTINFDKDKSRITNDGVFLVISSLPDNVTNITLSLSANNNKIIFSNSNIKTFDDYNLVDDQKYFIDFIKDCASNNIPTIGLIRNASLINQQSFFISLINYFVNNNNKNMDSTYWFGYDELWTQNKLNFEVLINNGIWNGEFEYTPDFEPQMFNLFKAGNLYSDAGTNVDMLIEYFTNIMNKNNVDKFDFVTDEIQFLNLLRQGNMKFFNFIFKHANRILIMSDGAYHTNTTVPYLTNLLGSRTPNSQEVIIQQYNDFLSGKTKTLTLDNILDFFVLKNFEQINSNSNFHFINFINYDANIFNSTNINDSQRWNESAFSTNFVDYSSIISDEENKQKYLDIFMQLFLDVDLSIDNLFVNGSSSYDPNKKNAIFLGSSLFKPISGDMSPTNFSRLDTMPTVKQEVQNTIAKFLDKYPVEEYNIIFKLHPIYSNVNDPEHQIAINYVKQITNNAITDPIIVNSSIPLESWIAADYYNYVNNNTTTPSILFKSSNPEEWTTFFGLQASSTTIQTTRLFYQSAFGIDKFKAAELIPFSNFPIPKLFPVISRIENDNTSYDYSKENLAQIQKLYEPYNPSSHYGTDLLEQFDSIILNF